MRGEYVRRLYLAPSTGSAPILEQQTAPAAFARWPSSLDGSMGIYEEGERGVM